MSRLDSQGIIRDGNLGVYYKSAGELNLMSGRHAKALGYFTTAVELFKTVRDMDLTGLIAECNSLISFAAGQIGGS